MGVENNTKVPATVMDVELSDGTHLIFKDQENGELEIPAAPTLTDDQIAEAQEAIGFQQDSEATGHAASQALNKLVHQQRLQTIAHVSTRIFAEISSLNLTESIIPKENLSLSPILKEMIRNKQKPQANFEIIYKLRPHINNKDSLELLRKFINEEKTKDSEFQRQVQQIIKGANDIHFEKKQ